MSDNKITIKNVRLSYANVWEPKANLQGDLKYSASLIIPKNSPEVAEVKRAINKAAKDNKAKFVDKKGRDIPKEKIRLPLRDGDIDRADEPAYEGCYFINVSSNNAPKIVNRRLKPIVDRSEVYSGCYANVSVNFFGYNTNGNAGIGAGLGNIQKLKDGEPLGGFSNPEDDFEVLDDDEFEDEFSDDDDLFS